MNDLGDSILDLENRRSLLNDQVRTDVTAIMTDLTLQSVVLDLLLHFFSGYAGI